jgi:hypothetical protein
MRSSSVAYLLKKGLHLLKPVLLAFTNLMKKDISFTNRALSSYWVHWLWVQKLVLIDATLLLDSGVQRIFNAQFHGSHAALTPARTPNELDIYQCLRRPNAHRHQACHRLFPLWYVLDRYDGVSAAHPSVRWLLSSLLLLQLRGLCWLGYSG